MKRQQRPKGYLISYKVKDKWHTIVVVHYTRKKASDLFLSYANHKGLLDVMDVNYVMARLHANKGNKHLFTDDFIKEEEDAINAMPFAVIARA